jgi:DNA-binding NarL/FixJ family response regulator
MDGVEATRRILSDHAAAGVRVLILTTYDLDEYVVEALRAGASGFLLKDSPAEDLVDAVRIVYRGEAVVGPRITRRLLDRFAKHLPTATDPRPSATADLTDREQDVLQLLAQGMSNAEIAAALVVSETTVKSHVSHLLTKLGLRDRVQAVIYAYQTGIVTPN